MEREVVKSYFETIRLTFIKHNMFDKLGAKIWNMDETGIVLDHKSMKVLARSGTKSLHGRSSGNKEVTTVIATVNANGGKSVIEILLDFAYGHPDYCFAFTAQAIFNG